MTTPTQPPTPTPAEVEAAFYAALDTFVASYLHDKGYEGVLALQVDVEALARAGVAVVIYKPRLHGLQPIAAPKES